MSTLEHLLGSVTAAPQDETLWLAIADWLEEHDDPRRGELLRLHRRLLATCCEPDAHPDRVGWQARVTDLLAAGVRPCVPGRAVQLPGGTTMSFSFVPPGRFLIGSDTSYGDEGPGRCITLTRGFYFGTHPVTQSQWSALMGTDPSRFKGPDRPVERLSWYDTVAFCERLTPLLKGRGTARLPTEAQWEYACRAGTRTVYYTGDGEEALRRAGWYRGNSPDGSTRPVGLLCPNPWGLYDLHGNVREWVDGRPVFYRAFDAVNPKGPPTRPDSDQVQRGGSCLSEVFDCRSSSRDHGAPGSSLQVGFRVAIKID